MSEIEDSTRWQLTGSYELFALGDADRGLLWLYDRKDLRYFKLNSSSYLILSSCDGKTTLGQIRERLQNQYPQADATAVAQDLSQFVVQMQEQGFINSP
ncbi:MAG: PqqD family protein [Chloroflexi bacterium]|nr:PqqD family protein [Chloroflexota bacterium]